MKARIVDIFYDSYRKLTFKLVRKHITHMLISRYCKGNGIEIGPGSVPYGRRSNTIYLDKYKHFQHKPLKLDIVSDAANIPRPDNSFDFLISSHCLEHHADTLKVLHEWIRVIKPGGILFLILPHGLRTFDRGRALTRLEHHIEDFGKKVEDNDKAHLDEFIRISVAQAQPPWLDEARYPDGSYNFDYMFNHGYMHFHVWTQNEMVKVLQYLKLEILQVIDKLPDRNDSFLVISRLPIDSPVSGELP